MAKIHLEFELSEVNEVIKSLQNLAVLRTREDMEAEAAKNNSEKIAKLTEDVVALGEKKSRRGGGTRWSRKHDSCIECHSATAKHAARGKCINCYMREFSRRNAKQIIPLDVRSEHVPLAHSNGNGRSPRVIT